MNETTRQPVFELYNSIVNQKSINTLFIPLEMLLHTSIIELLPVEVVENKFLS